MVGDEQTGDQQNERTQHCECGSELYHIKFELDVGGKVWAECAECGRPTASVGDGRDKQLKWYSEQ